MAENFEEEAGPEVHHACKAVRDRTQLKLHIVRETVIVKPVHPCACLATVRLKCEVAKPHEGCRRNNRKEGCHLPLASFVGRNANHSCAKKMNEPLRLQTHPNVAKGKRTFSNLWVFLQQIPAKRLLRSTAKRSYPNTQPAFLSAHPTQPGQP